MQPDRQLPWLQEEEKWRFFRHWLQHPRISSVLAPSSPQLVRSLVAHLPENAERVIELGTGSGALTAALLARGIRSENIVTLGIHPEVFRSPRQTLPEMTILCDESRAGRKSSPMQADAVISGLGMLSMPRALQYRLLQAAFERIEPEGCFIQSTYAPTCPVAPELLSALGLYADRGATVLRHVPPATVFVFRRQRSKALIPRSMR